MILPKTPGSARKYVDRLCETFDKDGWHILRDKTAMRPGDLISGFMKRIGLADHVIVVLSDKYLRSPYCITELHHIYQRSLGEKEDFLGRIIPLVLTDARFGTPEERVDYAKHWEARYLKLKSDLDHLSVEDFRLYKSMQKWHLDIGEMLTYVSDVLVPHGFDEIVKDDFAALRQMLIKTLGSCAVDIDEPPPKKNWLAAQATISPSCYVIRSLGDLHNSAVAAVVTQQLRHIFRGVLRVSEQYYLVFGTRERHVEQSSLLCVRQSFLWR